MTSLHGIWVMVENSLTLNSLWPSDALLWQGYQSTLTQVMACCLTAPRRYLNQCWLRSCDIHLKAFSQKITQPSITKISLKIISKASLKSLRGQWVNGMGPKPIMVLLVTSSIEYCCVIMINGGTKNLSLANTAGSHWEWLGAVRLQAITWVSLDSCHQMASLGHKELNKFGNLWGYNHCHANMMVTSLVYWLQLLNGMTARWNWFSTWTNFFCQHVETKLVAWRKIVVTPLLKAKRYHILVLGLKI